MDYVGSWTNSPFDAQDCSIWQLPERLAALLPGMVDHLGTDFVISDGVAVHRSSTVEHGATLKGSVVVGPRSFIAAGAYLRGGVFLEREVVVGPGVEIKSSVVLAGTRLAHFNFVGDSILGADVNLEAGAIIANYRNEAADRLIRIRLGGEVIDTGVEKFGALVGDGARIGANAVLSPGTVLEPGQVVPRLALVDQTLNADAQAALSSSSPFPSRD
jgi:UDP-N-acetylglucosamine diphosphorylase / glucose-1-phosphate thymidylyltransferase / UDP-N-acetylgalactosamine diphosphorylase / glucosamine-1-phosphate N-acetyltransferase / galactosamine-1-phosphate N-acetyltransferase